VTAVESRPLGHLYLALIAAGALAGALTAAGSCAIEWARGRRT
jgi:Na+(H+)/acetate symporter ActP